jgi:hypothetical protein
VSKNKHVLDRDTDEGAKRISIKRLHGILKNIAKEHDRGYVGHVFKTHKIRIYDTDFKLNGYRDANGVSRSVSIWCIGYQVTTFNMKDLDAEKLHDHMMDIARNYVISDVTTR